MKAVGYRTAGPIDRADALIDFETEKPVPTGHDLLVKVEAVSVNPVDYKIRQNRPPESDAPAVLGWDAVGTVVETGANATQFNAGDRVWYAGAINRPGTNSEYHLVDERIVGQAPESLSASEAAALPLTTLTAYEMLFDRLRVTDPVPGAANTIVIIGGAGGVGSIAIQLLKALTGVTIIATASRPETMQWVKDLGAHHVVDHSKDLTGQITDLGLGSPAFVFATNQSDAYTAQAAEFMAPQGRFGLIDDPQSFDIMPFKHKSISVHWEFMYSRSLFATADIIRQSDILTEVSKLADAGKIKTTATESLGNISATNLKSAHEFLETGKAKGKLVLEGF
ncbi:zinc-binding alcohol dehydrogenase family protein [Labrenzia sp. PHM005]|uniref:zinc-binding alcohol dehydrogenase family protein n=1 Tax=Labrenzia sp. PHM005 TaxID=2590016 RepID=UPI0011403202|nr:zinc-binding alcohol dehydrogenase family protein [Labrenzia sp. PHM005]QDG75870.1 zinc-binding alcohol dehydrogenase family protein [Labrenzia sp. PHM005]